MNANRNMHFTLILRHSHQTLNIYGKDRHCWNIIDRPKRNLQKEFITGTFQI